MHDERPTSDPTDEERSPGGSQIFRHAAAKGWQPPQGEECIAQISAHVERHLGPVAWVYHEILSDLVHIDVHVVKPTPEQPYVRLVTSGMSDLPMTTPASTEVPRFAELMLTLPPDWRVDAESFKDEAWYWPVRLLKTLARLPHQYDTWLGWGHTIPHGDPATPFADNVRFAGAIVLPSMTAPKAFETLDIDEGKRITFYAVWPLFPGEMDFKLKKGTNDLIDCFEKHRVTDAVDPARKDATRKRFGFW
jgi:hypothetical protein